MRTNIFRCVALVATFATTALTAGHSLASDPTFTFRTIYSLAVGEKATVYAVRGPSCSADAPAFAPIATRLPKSGLGSYSDGGTTQRMSANCNNSWVKARAIDFTATKSGSEILTFFGDSVTINVK